MLLKYAFSKVADHLGIEALSLNDEMEPSDKIEQILQKSATLSVDCF